MLKEVTVMVQLQLRAKSLNPYFNGTCSKRVIEPQYKEITYES